MSDFIELLEWNMVWRLGMSVSVVLLRCGVF